MAVQLATRVQWQTPAMTVTGQLAFVQLLVLQLQSLQSLCGILLAVNRVCIKHAAQHTVFFLQHRLWIQIKSVQSVQSAALMTPNLCQPLPKLSKGRSKAPSFGKCRFCSELGLPRPKLTPFRYHQQIGSTCSLQSTRMRPSIAQQQTFAHDQRPSRCTSSASERLSPAARLTRVLQYL